MLHSFQSSSQSFFFTVKFCLLRQLLKYYLGLVFKGSSLLRISLLVKGSHPPLLFPGALESIGLHVWGRGTMSFPKEYPAVSGDICDDHGGEREGVADRWRPGTLLHFHRTATPTENDRAPNVNTPKVRNPALIKLISSFTCLYILASSVLTAPLC